LIFKGGASSRGQINTAGTYPEDFDMSTVVLKAGVIITGSAQLNPITVLSENASVQPIVIAAKLR
jgi:hypothetical protein